MEELSFKDYIMKVLGAVSIAIIVGLVPNAILGEVFKSLQDKHIIFKTLLMCVQVVQLAVPALIGALVSREFSLNPIESATVIMVTFLASGNVKFTENGFQIAGIGDLINTIIIVAIAVYVVQLLRGKLGNLNIVLLPIIMVVVIGGLGVFTLPYVAKLTGAIGSLVQHVTTLQPLLMSIILAIIFAILIISPFSTVAVALAISLAGLGSGAANIGICATTAVLVVGSIKVNDAGTTIAALLGSPKMFMKNWFANPVMNLPIILSAAVSGVFAYLFNIQGTPQSAGFGFSGLVGPINAISKMEGEFIPNILVAILVFFVIPFASAIIFNLLFTKVAKLMTYDVYKFGGKK